MPANGEPVFSSWLKLPVTFTDTEGRFAIAGLTPGPYAVSALTPDGSEGIGAGIAAGDTSAVIRVERSGTIDGALADFPSIPVVFVWPVGRHEAIEPSRIDRTSFRVAGLRPGRYLVNAQTPDEGDAQIVDVRSGSTTSVSMRPHGHGIIEVTVLAFKSHAPIAGAACRVVMTADGMQGLTRWERESSSTTDASGHARLDPAPAGSVAVVCDVPSLQLSEASADLELPAGGRAAVQLLSAEVGDYPASIGIDVDHRMTTPRITAVQPDGPAAKAGVLVGDVITAIDGTSVLGLNGLGALNAIANRTPGSDVSVTVQRGASRMSFSMTTMPLRTE
jgi:hypothetical protein